MDAQTAGRLVEFARGCKAAARAVSLYPDGHPAVRGALARLVEASQHATVAGPLQVTVVPDNLLVGGLPAEKPDSAVPELAGLLHRHHIGSFIVHDAADAETWRTLLRLLSRSPEEVRTQGGIARLWSEDGGITTVQQRGSVQISEIDYQQILSGVGGPQTLAAIIEACLAASASVDLDPVAQAALAAMLSEPSQLEALAATIQERAAAGGPDAQARAMMRLIRGAVGAVQGMPQGPAKEALGSLAVAVAGLSAPAMTTLLDQRGTAAGQVGSVDAVGTVIAEMPQEAIAGFVAGSVVAEGGPTDRLAHAFQALVPEFDSRRQLLSLAHAKVAASPLGETESFPDIWQRTEQMLTSYSDEQYVHRDYARELDRARTQAVEVEQTSDDPPERVEGWLATVGDGELKQLDLQLLLDLLGLETDPYRWRDIAGTVVEHIEDLAATGHVAGATRLIDAIVECRGEAEEIPAREESRRAFALAVLERIASGAPMRHVLELLRSNDEAVFESVKRLCTMLGPPVVTSLAEVLAAEHDARARRRIRDILLGFGRKGRDAIKPLLNAPNWEVRQTAAFLLREFGGTEGLPELERLLSDSEPLVQREAIRALILIGDERTYAVLARVLAARRSRSRETLVQQLTAQRDQRAVPLCVYLIRHIDHRALSDVYMVAIETLGSIGSPEAVEPLKQALYRGDWWAPVRTRMLREAAAQALRRTKLPEALQVLREAAARGPRGVRLAARAQLRQLGEIS